MRWPYWAEAWSHTMSRLRDATLPAARVTRSATFNLQPSLLAEG
jgi:hypothetical protein